ncbi:hypothetical protein RAS2_25090 [Phycisphaerae bacterium RAS2]|nr:hypothetical protein RAS2_25090 [Phycisphaerae bacterium RAS2]
MSCVPLDFSPLRFFRPLRFFWQAYQNVYKDYPEWLNTIGHLFR